MHLQELKRRTPADLVALAEEMGVENASTLRKQDIIFAILKADAEAGGYSLPADVFSTGVVLVAIWHSAVVFDASEDDVTDTTEAVRRSGELPWIVPCRIARLVRRLTSHYPEQRPSAGEAAAVLMAMASAHDAIAAVAEEVDAPAGASSVRPPHPRPWKLPWPSWRRRRGTGAARRPVQLSVKV